MKELSFKYRFCPTKEQERLLACTFGCVRFVYNNILSWRKELYNTEKTNISYNKASSRLTNIKKEISFLNDVSSVPLQQSLRHQQTAFTNFFKKHAKKPKFKSKHSNQSIELTNGAFRLKDGLLYTWQMEMLGFRAKEKDLIRGKILQECKCISKCFNDEVDFFNSPQRARLISFYLALVFLDLVDTKPAKHCLS